MPRMNILGALEKEAHDTPPRFSAAERKKYFTLSSTISELVASFRSSTNKVCFVLAYGYFRAATRPIFLSVCLPLFSHEARVACATRSSLEGRLIGIHWTANLTSDK